MEEFDQPGCLSSGHYTEWAKDLPAMPFDCDG